jgi:ornithine decarboxylase
VASNSAGKETHIIATKLAQRATQLEQGFPGMVSYAVKANPEPRVHQTLVDLGLQHFDVASVKEILSVLGIHPEATLHFNNPVKADGFYSQ